MSEWREAREPIIIHTDLPSTSHFASNFPPEIYAPAASLSFAFPFPPFPIASPISEKKEGRRQFAIANPILFFVAFICDFLFLFFLSPLLSGTAGIIMAAPSHYDLSKPIDIQYSRIEMKNLMKKEEL